MNKKRGLLITNSDCFVPRNDDTAFLSLLMRNEKLYKRPMP